MRPNASGFQPDANRISDRQLVLRHGDCDLMSEGSQAAGG